MLPIPARECLMISSIFNELYNTTLNHTNVALLSDAETIRNSDNFDCIVSFLVPLTTVFICDMNDKHGCHPMPNRPDVVLLHTNLTDTDINNETFEKLYWPIDRYSRKVLLNKGVKVLVIEEQSFDNTHLWLQELCDFMLAVDVTVAVLEQDVRFYTWFPYQEDECRNVSTVVDLEPTQLFPRKDFNDLHGCPLEIRPVYTAPFVIDENNGIEIKMVLIMAKKLNATPQLELYSSHDPNVDDYYSDLLIFNKVDIIVGLQGMALGNFEAFEALAPFTFETWGYVCPGPKRVSRMILLVRAFPLKLWVFVVAAIFAIGITCSFLGDKDYTLRACSIFLGLSFGDTQLNIKNIFLVLCYLSSNCIVSLYQASLFQLLQTVPRERPIKTLTELLGTNFTFFYRDEDLPVSPNPDRIIDTFFLPFEELADGYSYGSVPLTMYQYNYRNRSWYFDESGYPLHIILEEGTTRVGVNFIMSPGHPLRDIFSEITQKLVEGGIVDHWKEYYGRQGAVYDKFENESIALAHVEGAFCILGIFLLASFIIFFLELFFYKF